MKYVIAYLFDDLKKQTILASIDPGNLNSINLIEKLGFRKEANFKQSIFLNDEWVDYVIYSLHRKDVDFIKM